jgi:outer membrane immunogenic protein
MIGRRGTIVALALLLATGCAVPAQAQSLYDGSGPVYDTGSPMRGGLFDGWWLGGTIGGATSSTRFSGTHSDISGSGLIGGVTGGYNWQNGPIVIGLEGDVLTGEDEGNQHFDGGAYNAKTSLGTTGDLRLRAGVTVVPQVLVFATLGTALTDSNYAIIGSGGGSTSDPLFGWTVGGGAEVAFSKNWSARFDYQYTDFDSNSVSYSGGKDKFDANTNSYRGSLIYHF